MSDIVERLRAKPWHKDVLVCEDVCVEAADEIERLQREEAEIYGRARREFADEIERLLASLQWSEEVIAELRTESAQQREALAAVETIIPLAMQDSNIARMVRRALEPPTHWLPTSGLS